MANGARDYFGRPNVTGVNLLTVGSNETAGTYYGDPSVLLSECAVLVFELDANQVASDVGDTLDVYVQTLVGDDWFDIVHFTQILGNGGVKAYIAKVLAGSAESMFDRSAVLAAGSVRNIVGDQYRCKYVIVNTASPDFGFTLKASGL